MYKRPFYQTVELKEKAIRQRQPKRIKVSILNGQLKLYLPPVQR